MGQTVLPLGQNLLEILGKYNKLYAFFIKIDQIFDQRTAWVKAWSLIKIV